MHRSNISILFCKLLGSLVFFWLAACQSTAPTSSIWMLKPGDHVAGMRLTTGAVEVPPIWAFCLPQDNNLEIAFDCRIPATLSELGIGSVIIMADETIINLDWAGVTWNLSIDEQPVNLDLFGTYDFVLPSMVSNPGPIREVFRKFTAWDVVMTDLKPGRHTLRGTAQSEFDTYTWVVDLVIEEPSVR